MFDFSKTFNVRPASSSRNNCPINVVTAFAFLNGFVQMEVKTRQKHGESPPVVGLADWIAQRTFGTLWTNSISNATYNPKVIFETEFLCLSFVFLSWCAHEYDVGSWRTIVAIVSAPEGSSTSNAQGPELLSSSL